MPPPPHPTEVEPIPMLVVYNMCLILTLSYYTPTTHCPITCGKDCTRWDINRHALSLTTLAYFSFFTEILWRPSTMCIKYRSYRYRSYRSFWAGCIYISGPLYAWSLSVWLLLYFRSPDVVI